MKYLKFEMLYKGSNGWAFTAFGWTVFCWHKTGMKAIGQNKKLTERFEIHTPSARRLTNPLKRFA